MQKTAVVTGGGTGLGQAIARTLALKGINVIIIGRRSDKLKLTQATAKDRILPLCADVSSVQGRNKIYQKLESLNIKIDYLIHNAAIVLPIAPLEKLVLKKFQEALAINLEAPLFLTKILLPLLNSPARILHISSDSALYPLANWIPYCVSKAGLLMLYQCLKKEFEDRPIFMGSVDPGLMDTPMQDYILRPEVVFPEKMTVEEMEEKQLILPPEICAKYCVKLLLDVDAQKFSEKEWKMGEKIK